MSERKRMFVLIPVLILVWGMVIYRVYDAIKDDTILKEEAELLQVPVQEKKSDHELALDYPDPFLKTAVAKPVVVVKNVSAKKVERKPEKKVQTVPKPVLRYSGRVENRESKKERHLISVNGNPHIVSVGEEIDGVALKKVFVDSVEFKWNKETIFVRR